MSNPIRILVVDDHAVVREGLAAILNRRSDMQVVAEANSSATAILRFRETMPDVTLMDFQLPDRDGVETLAILRSEFPNARIVVLTTFAEDENIYRALRAGARGFLMKDAPKEALLEAVTTAAAGGTYLPFSLGTRLAIRMNRPNLTEREMDVLKLIATGCSNQEIGTRLFIEESTVKSHVNNLLRKMSVMDRTQAVVKGLEQGLISLQPTN